MLTHYQINIYIFIYFFINEVYRNYMLMSNNLIAIYTSLFLFLLIYLSLNITPLRQGVRKSPRTWRAYYYPNYTILWWMIPWLHTLTFVSTYSLTHFFLSLSFPLIDSLSRSPLLLSSTLDGRRVAILALGLFVKTTTELALSPLHPIMRAVSFLILLFLCLRVSVLIRHFVDTHMQIHVCVCVCMCVYIYTRYALENICLL